MALGDGIRRNIKDVDPAERALLRDALVQLNNRFFGGNRTDTPPGGVSWWFKQDEIHQATHVHGGPEFLPWHRVVVNRLEEMLRQINPQLSLHYWDWTEDPRSLPNANLGGGTTGTLNLFDSTFMGYGGNTSASIGEPWFSAGYYDPSEPNQRDVTNNPADPPGDVVRNIAGSPATVGQDTNVIDSGDYATMRGLLEGVHNGMHGFVNMGSQHFSFRDPFVYFLHANVDRLFAMWQFRQAPLRLDPVTVYGTESNLDVTVGARIQNVNNYVEPWSTGHSEDQFGVPHVTRPWSAPENEGVAFTYKHLSVVTPPCYNTLLSQVTFETLNVNFGNIPEGLTSFHAARIKVVSCHPVKFIITQNPTGNFALTPMGTQFSYEPKVTGGYGDAFVWIQFTALGSGLQTTTIKVQAYEDSDPANPQNIGAEQTITFSATPLARANNSIALILDRSGSMATNAGGTSTRSALMKTAVGVFATLMRPTDEIGLVGFDDQVATLLPMTPQSTGLVQVITLLVGDGLNPRGATGIGLGIQQGNTVLTSADPTFNKVMLVLTDGNENVHPYINELAPGTITAKTYGIGFGLPAEVSAPVLNQITNNTNGDLIVTGNITTEEQRFLLTKHFVQVLNGIDNNQVILDPQGSLFWGAVDKIPFIVSEADVSLECIALCPVPQLLSFKLETPDGKVIDPTAAGSEPNVTYIDGEQVSLYRITLPALPDNPAGSHQGTWKAILQIKSREEIEELIKKEVIKVRDLAKILKNTLPYNFMAQSYSNLTFSAKSIQTSFEPDAMITLQASLNEYDLPVEKRAAVTAYITKPDLSMATLELKETENGIFEAKFKASSIGNYAFRLIAKGSTLKGSAFTREKTVTAGVFLGGDRYHDNTALDSLIAVIHEKEKRFCALLDCIFNKDVIGKQFEKNLKEKGLNLDQFRKCLKNYCRSGRSVTGKAVEFDFKNALQDPIIKSAMNRLETEFLDKDETFGFARLPYVRSNKEDDRENSKNRGDE